MLFLILYYFYAFYYFILLINKKTFCKFVTFCLKKKKTCMSF